MSRIALMFASILLPAALYGCSEECASPDDCNRDEVCYKQTCRQALHEDLDCDIDDDCGPAPANGPRPFQCIAGRCALAPGAVSVADAGTSTSTDAGP